jgi:7-keto-8-aminopelargonate synthetase-like enzyme
MTFKPSDYSVADFFVGDSDDPVVPSDDFVAWREATTWATSLYEPRLHGAAVARTRLESGGETRAVINFASYNYLGLSKHPDTIAAAQAALLKYGTGGCGSPMLSGMTDLHAEFERELSRFLGTESSILFNSGYIGALSTLSALLRRADVAIADSKTHISAVEGVRLSGARLVMFEHNSPESLAECLDRHRDKRRLVLLEGLYSMEGDLPRLPELLEVADHYKVSVFIDEAHSMLTCGARGHGATEHFDVEGRVSLKYATMSKGFGAIGGAVSGSRKAIDYIRVYANGYGFSVALPASVVAGLLAALRVAENQSGLRERLWSNGNYFREKLREIGVDTGPSNTFVIPIMIGDNRARLYDLCHRMRQRGLFLPPVDYPVVPQDQVRFRASVTALHTQEDLDEALNIIEDTIVGAIGKQI